MNCRSTRGIRSSPIASREDGVVCYPTEPTRRVCNPCLVPASPRTDSDAHIRHSVSSPAGVLGWLLRGDRRRAAALADVRHGGTHALPDEWHADGCGHVAGHDADPARRAAGRVWSYAAPGTDASPVARR